MANRPNITCLNYGRIYTQAAIDTALGLANPSETATQAELLTTSQLSDPSRG